MRHKNTLQRSSVGRFYNIHMFLLLIPSFPVCFEVVLHHFIVIISYGFRCFYLHRTMRVCMFLNVNLIYLASTTPSTLHIKKLLIGCFSCVNAAPEDERRLGSIQPETSLKFQGNSWENGDCLCVPMLLDCNTRGSKEYVPDVIQVIWT